MKHRLRRKHPWLNCGTDASNEMCLKETQEKKETEKTKDVNMKKRNEKHESGVTLKWAFHDHLSTETQKTNFDKRKSSFLQ